MTEPNARQPTSDETSPAAVVAAAAPKGGLPSLVQRMVDAMQMSRLAAIMRLQNRPAKPKPAGLWPRDSRGQYVSDRRDSHGNLVTKRSKHVKAVQ